MTRLILIWLLASLTWALSAGRQRPTFRATTDVVVIDVLVLDGTSPVRGLSAGDFRVTDDGVPQAVELLVGAAPLDISLVVDSSGSVERSIGQFWGQVKDIRDMVQPTDRIGLITDATDVKQVLPVMPVPSAWPKEPIASGATTIVDATLQALIATGGPGRLRIVVVFTDGSDNASACDPRSLSDVASRADARLEVVLTGGSTGGRERLGQAAGVRPLTGTPLAFQQAAVASGGSVIRSSGDVAGDLRQILRRVRQSYVLQYKPIGEGRLGWHAVSVNVIKPGAEKFVVTGRRGYVR